ncbi:MAG: hypothetical protein HOO19_17395 [Rhodospirillaceae bacterium]|jgi:CHASE3 domain sensor protein|nr:hypothetical protein [Rhodospirillaceae bacterium]MBT3885342.1 hypothetical protein [Rhodospirillaceae bacterium]MBT4117542.1 hypothetical protein [Rhodospirillaceae bacterium]MBT4671610.1 hypothetical protein [Rhodospirillaceae bacterium]MBT4751114.1 hypothetical protein [Rhodospirillaceae bacterium]
MNLKVRGKLILGFFVVALVLAAAVGSTIWKVNDIAGISDRIVDLRTPTSAASQRMLNNIGADPDNMILGLSWDLCARAALATINKIA